MEYEVVEITGFDLVEEPLIYELVESGAIGPNVIPTGGAIGQLLKKSTLADYAVEWFTITNDFVGLGNVTNDAQLKRAAGDFSTFSERTSPQDADVILQENSSAGGGKYWLTFANLYSYISGKLSGVFLKLSGVIGGQTANGGTDAGEPLDLNGTSHSTKGPITFNGVSQVDKNGRFATPTGSLGGYLLGTSSLFYEVAPGVTVFAVNDVDTWYFNEQWMGGLGAGQPLLRNEEASATNPTLIPHGSDSDSGIGGNGAGRTNIIANSKNIIETNGNTGADYSVQVNGHDIEAPVVNVNARAGQLEPLQEWDVAGVNKASIDKDGMFSSPYSKTNPIGTITGATNLSALYTDHTADFTASFTLTLTDFSTVFNSSAFYFTVSGGGTPTITLSSTPAALFWPTQTLSALADGDYTALFILSGPLLTGTSLSYVDGGAGDDTIVDLDSRFLDQGFEVGQTITTANSTTGGNDLSAITITGVTASTLSFATSTLAASETFLSGTILYNNITSYGVRVQKKP